MSSASAVSSVKAEDLAGQPIASVDAALQGKAPGVQVVQNAGNPGNAPSVRVRGSASVSASNDPLYVMDGVPIVAGDISQLDAGGQSIAAITSLSADEIESVDILKDAAATAIYGSRGSNGVVMITTKRGVAGRTNVTFNSYVGTQSASRRLALLNGRVPGVLQRKRVQRRLGRELLWRNRRGRHRRTPTGRTDAPSAPISSSELAVSGGNERCAYRLSGNWFDQEGIVQTSGYRRVGGRFNLDFNPTGTLSLRTGLSVSVDRNNRVEDDGSDFGIITNAVGESPLVPAVQPSGEFSTPDDGLEYLNPAALLAFDDLRARSTSILGNVEARLRITSFIPLHQPGRGGSGQPQGRPVSVAPGRRLLRCGRQRRGQEGLFRGGSLRDRQLRHPASQPRRPP